MTKQIIRNNVWAELRSYGKIPTFKGQEQAAEKLRRMDVYRNSNTIFVPPDKAQYPVRSNIVEDGKTLIMATPGLRDGFYKIDDPGLDQAISSRGISKYGERLKTSYEDIGRIELMVTGAVAVSRRGERIGKGTGYFDWEYKILRETGCVDKNTLIIAIVHELQVYDELPFDEHDVSIDYIVTSNQTLKVEKHHMKPKGIDWEYVKENEGLIKKMRPLRELSKYF